MRPLRRLAIAAAPLAVVIGGCGVGAGEGGEGTASLVVTRDHGSETILEATVSDPAESETVVRFLDREAQIETSYGGNFVDSIEGIAGGVDDGRREDWFFYVNGYWSDVGAGEARVRPGDRVWWDHRDWTDAYRVSAVVGSWPQPFLGGLDGEGLATEVVCFAGGGACEAAAERLTEAGAETSVRSASEPGGDPDSTLRVLVGEWERVRSDPAASTLEKGPGESGVFAVPERCGGGWALSVRDESDTETGLLAEAGWVAAVRRGAEPAVWIVSATGAEALDDAVGLLDEEQLAERYAVAVPTDSEPLALPDEAGAATGGGSC